MGAEALQELDKEVGQRRIFLWVECQMLAVLIRILSGTLRLPRISDVGTHGNDSNRSALNHRNFLFQRIR